MPTKSVDSQLTAMSSPGSLNGHNFPTRRTVFPHYPRNCPILVQSQIHPRYLTPYFIITYCTYTYRTSAFIPHRSLSDQSRIATQDAKTSDTPINGGRVIIIWSASSLKRSFLDDWLPCGAGGYRSWPGRRCLLQVQRHWPGIGGGWLVPHVSATAVQYYPSQQGTDHSSVNAMALA